MTQATLAPSPPGHGSRIQRRLLEHGRQREQRCGAGVPSVADGAGTACSHAATDGDARGGGGTDGAARGGDEEGGNGVATGACATCSDTSTCAAVTIDADLCNTDGDARNRCQAG